MTLLTLYNRHDKRPKDVYHAYLSTLYRKKDCGIMAEYSPGAYRAKPTRATHYLAGLLEESDKPVLTQFDFFQIIRQMYRESPDKKLYLRNVTPSREDYFRLRSSLNSQGVLGPDRDYGARVIRVLAISDLKALSASSIQHAIFPTSPLCSGGDSPTEDRMP